ncbi:MAG: Mov34/MPN/PAD-1 family protein [Vicinamibacterales bacterium]
MDEAVIDRLVQHARRSAPDECCGLLVGDGGRLLHDHPAANADPAPRRRYLIDPSDHFAAIKRAREAGLQVVGAYHSHPRGSAVPSATDAAEGFADFLFVIVGLGGREPDVRGWEWKAGNFMPVRLVRTR